MDSFFKFEKENGNQILSNLKRLLNVFRIVEICVILILLSRISFQFQFPVGDYVKKILSFLLSHRFVFVIGNAIVITLFAKLGKDDSNNPDHKNPKLSSADSTYDFSDSIRNTSRVSQSGKQKVPSVANGIQNHEEPTQKTEELSQNIPVKNLSAGDISLIRGDNQFIISVFDDKKKHFQRSQSECLEVEKFVKPCRVLRRTVTDSSREKVICTSGESDNDDGMSDEEFRVMVEKFIANQQQILREEEKCWSWSHAAS